jgi:hypothetical protein
MSPGLPKLRYARRPGRCPAARKQLRSTPMTLSRYFDRIAIALSTICIVHCIAMPFIVALLPLAAISFGGDAHFHQLMLWLVVPTSIVGFALGFRVHRRASIILAGAAAVALLTTAALWGHAAWNAPTEVAVSLIASILLATAHWRNFREVRRLHEHHREPHLSTGDY